MTRHEQLELGLAPCPSELDTSYRRAGHYTDAVLGALLRRNQRDFASATAVVDEDITLTWANIGVAASRFAGFLGAHDIGPRAVVVWQLPNWWEALIVAYGTWLAGAVNCPILPNHREHGLKRILQSFRPSCVVAPSMFGTTSYVELLDTTIRELDVVPDARVVVRGSARGWTMFEDALRASPFAFEHVAPTRPAVLAFTSGTTAEPKGVVHSTRTYLASSIASARQRGFTHRDRFYMPSPIAHAAGLSRGIGLPLVTGASVVLRDRWDPEQAVDDIRNLHVTVAGGPAVLLQDTVDVVRKHSEPLSLPHGWGCGGAAAPAILMERAEELGLRPHRAYGMTECINATGSTPEDPSDVRLYSDGTVSPGMEIRSVSPAGTDLPPGEAGELLVRGPQRALGYLDPVHTAESFDDHGWFRTGDVGVVDSDRRVTVTGRIKEIINRGGQKISSREIEEALCACPIVRDAAVVAAPDERLGEQPAAFVLLTSGATASSERLVGYLKNTGLAAHKLPRIWKQVRHIPRNASGKIDKSLLQDQLGSGSVKGEDVDVN